MDGVYPLETELNLVDPGSVRFSRDKYDELVMHQDGHEHAGVRLIRGFPHSAPQRMLSVRTRTGDELGMVANLTDLDDASRQVVWDELESAYFIPRIDRILNIEERFHVPFWEVETDRGPRRFEVRSGRSDVRVHGALVLIQDADGNHYTIPDYRHLDPASRTLLESQI